MKLTSWKINALAAGIIAAVLLHGCGGNFSNRKDMSMSNTTKRQARTYKIPETRLPFVNGEIAEIDFQGRPHLVSATWMGGRGRLYFWDPSTGKTELRDLPQGVPGAYVLKRGPDKKLYMGCGNGDLYRYDPAGDSFEALATGVMNSITWGGCVTERHVVWAASPGDACIYDLKEKKLVKKLSPLDTQEPNAHYGHTVIATPDGKAIAFVNVPQTRIIAIDPATGETRIENPAEMKGAAWTTQAAFLDASTIVALVQTTPPAALLIDYPSLKVKSATPVPEGLMPTNQRACLLNGALHAYFGTTGSLYRFNAASKSWELVIKGWLEEAGGVLGVWGGHTLVALKSDGKLFYYDSRTGKTSEGQIEAWGPLEAHALCVAPEANMIVGAPFINRRFWTIDLATGEGKDRGIAVPLSGQVNQIAWDGNRRKALISGYTQAALSEYDPARGGQWPENPRLVASAKPEGQLRPEALVFDGRHAWMATSPNYGTLGGALSRFDPATNEKRVWRNIVPDQTITGILLDKSKKRLYCSSWIYADCESCPPTQTTAQLFEFDTQRLEVTRRQEIAGEPALRTLCLLPDGGVLAMSNSKVYRWEPDSGKVQDLGEVPGLKYATVDEKGTLWAVARGGIGRLKLENSRARLEMVIPETRKILLLQIIDNTLYYPAGTQVHAVPLETLK